MILYHSAAKLRAGEFNYLSLETVLSDAGAISQIPMNWITIISSGRSNIIDCGAFGKIEFIHTTTSPKRSSDAKTDFTWEMRRFLPSQIISSTIEKDQFWHYLTDLVQTECMHIIHMLNGE
jgi:hypothetical protein